MKRGEEIGRIGTWGEERGGLNWYLVEMECGVKRGPVDMRRGSFRGGTKTKWRASLWNGEGTDLGKYTKKWTRTGGGAYGDGVGPGRGFWGKGWSLWVGGRTWGNSRRTKGNMGDVLAKD